MDLSELEEDFSEEEIKQAIWDLGADRAPRPDRYPMFFQKFCQIVKEDITNLIIKVGEGTAWLDKISYSQIVLISKKENLTTVRDFRPIALLNRLFKIISKILTNRLSPVIGEMIGEYQTSFIKGRSILPEIVIAKEVIHQCRRTN